MNWDIGRQDLSFMNWDIEIQVKIEEQRYHTLNMKIDKLFILSIKVSVLEI